MKELLTAIVQNLVDDAESVQITEITEKEDEPTVLDVSSNRDDVGKIVGKRY